MNLLAGQSREALRQMYVESWQKFVGGRPLSPLEATIADVIAMHGEYQSLLGDRDLVEHFDADTSGAADNPFLHMGLHLAIREQVATDRPPGIRAVHAQLAQRGSDAHAADHRLMQVLAQILWDAQQANRAPDEAVYLRRSRQLLT